MRLLVVEDDRPLSSILCRGLQKHGFVSDCIDSLDSIDEALLAADYDVIILDLNISDCDGLEWLRGRKGRAVATPILVISARTELAHRVEGLDAGADDYLVKPFDLEELAARLRALIRRPGMRDQPTLNLGNLRLNVASRCVHVGDVELDLSRRELAMLELLLRRAGTVVSKVVIANSLYGFDEPVTTNAVEALASRLRTKLEGVGAGEMILTRRGLGYLLRSGEP